MDIDRFSATIAQIYDASLNVEGWDRVLVSFTELFSSDKAQIIYYTSFHDSAPFLRYYGIDQGDIGLLSQYRELTPTDPRKPPRSFKAYHCRELVPDETMRATAIYQRVLAPMRIEYSMYFVIDLEDDSHCAVAIMRGPGDAPFTRGECEDFSRFIPHVGRAVAMHGVLRAARGAAAAAQALIDQMPLGMMVLHGQNVVLTNAAARALVAQGDILRWSGDRLQAVTAQGQARLGRAMQEAQTTPGTPVGVSLPAGESGHARMVICTLAPSASAALGVASEALGVYLTDTRQPVETPEEVLRRLFGLTDREATVLRALVQGDNTAAIARRLGISEETAKTHLRHIMQSVGVGRQVDLVRLVLSSPAWIAGAPRMGRQRRGQALH
jgi:DNA-binding CsgD family transcriptional regulator